MKVFCNYFGMFAFSMCLFSVTLAQKLAVPQRYVEDRANIVSDIVENDLNGYLHELEQKTGTQMVVLTINTTGDIPIETYSIELATKWKLGQKGKDNGVLIVIAKDDRAYRIEIGYGLEGILSDTFCGTVGRTYLMPYFQKGQFSEGISQASVAMVHKIAEENGVKITGITKAADPNWPSDEQTGCKVWNPDPQPNESISWSGDCVDGKAHGNGILRFYENGEEYFQYVITTKNGLMMVNGVLTAKVEPSSVVFNMRRCTKYENYRVVIGVVEKEIDLSYNLVAKHLLEKAANFAEEKCPRKRFRNIHVFLSRDSKDPIQNFAVKARNYDENKLTWFEYDNNENEKLHAEYRAKREEKKRLEWEAKKQLEAEKKRLEMEARKAREVKEKEEARKRLNEFILKNGVEKWLTTEALAVNPFIYEDKTVAIVAEFEEMLSATEGVFAVNELFVVSGIPKGLFTKKARVVLAGSVVGKTELKWKFMQMLVPHLKFVGVHFCKDLRCSDMFPD